MLKTLKRHKLLVICISIIPLAIGAVAIAYYAGVIHPRNANSQSHQYDIIVYGAGPGGVAASIQAASMGAHVALLEPTDWIGGQMTTAGVGNMDEGSTRVRNYGLYATFIHNATSYYKSQNVSISTCYGGKNSICIDPKEGQAVLTQMLKKESPNLQVFTGTQVSSVMKQGDTVEGVGTNKGDFQSKIVIDADEYGDLLAMSGAAYRLGNGTNTNPNPNACTQSLTYTAVIKKYLNGVPSQLVFHSQPPGYTPEVVARFKQSFVRGFSSFIAFRGLPDTSQRTSTSDQPNAGGNITRTSLDVDLANDYPMDGTLSTQFISDPNVRAQDTCQAKLLTLQLIYYIQHDMNETNWSIANDEDYNTPYNRQQQCSNLKGYEAFENQMPQEPYVREARRLIGVETLTGDELAQSWQHPKNIATYPNSIAVGYYPMDVHNCRTSNTLESAYDKPSDAPTVHKGGPFEVPLGVLIPQSTNGLLAAEKNISNSRLANGAIREQAVSMDIGQAVGALAAVAVHDNEQPRNVPAAAVQKALNNAGLPIVAPTP